MGFLTSSWNLWKAVAVVLLLGEVINAFSPSHVRIAPKIEKNERAFSLVPSRSSAVSSPLTRLSTTYLPMPSGQSRFNVIQKLKDVERTVGTKLQKHEISLWRAAAVTFFGSCFLFRKAIDVKLASFWTYLITSQSLVARIFRTDSYEWCLAVGCFLVYIHAFGYADRAVRKASEQGKVHPWRKYRLQDRYEADKHRRMIERRTEEGKQVSAEQAQPPVKTKQSEWNWQAWFGEFWVYVLPLLTWDILSPRRHRRIGAFGAPTTLGILGGVAGGLLLYDLFFFCGHVLMHKIPFLYNTIHVKHHKVQEVRAPEIVRLSIAEEVLEVGFSIVALNLLGVHPLARSIFNCIITFLLTELHCGFDFPWTPQNVVPFGLATGSRRHHYHHRIGKHYYQKFFFHVDRLFGFFQKDDGSLNGDSVKPKPFIPPSWK